MRGRRRAYEDWRCANLRELLNEVPPEVARTITRNCLVEDDLSWFADAHALFVVEQKSLNLAAVRERSHTEKLRHNHSHTRT